MCIKHFCFALSIVATGTLVQAAEPLSVETFFRNQEFSDVRLSPDGKYLSAIARIEAAPRARNLIVMEIATRQSKILTAYKEEDVRFHFWANSERLIFTVDRDQDSTTKENLYMGTYSVLHDGSKGRTLHEPFKKDRRGMRGTRRTNSVGGVRQTLQILNRLPNDEKHILVARAEARFMFPDAIRMNIETGTLKPAALNERNTWQWFADHRGKVRAATDAGEDQEDRRSELIYRNDEDSPWETIAEYTTGALKVFGFDQDNHHLWVASRVDRDKFALFRLDPQSGDFGDPVYEDDEYDIYNFSVQNVMGLARSAIGEPLFLQYMADVPKTIFLDDTWNIRQRALDKVFPGTVNTIVDWDDQQSKFLILCWSDRVYGDYYLYDEEKAEVKYLLSPKHWFEKEAMAQMQPVSFQARDGVTLHGYLTLPIGMEDKAVPLLVYPHGGPYGFRESWGFDSDVQFLASRGYGVIQIDYRGSGGYGDGFESSGYRQWGLAMQDDLSDGVKWAVDQGLANPDRICIYGASYGGYATMMGLTKTPDLYKCGINYVGVVDLLELYEQVNDGYNVAGLRDAGKSWWNMAMGSPREHKDRLRETSPINAIENIRAPVLVIHGRLDYNVEIEQYQALVSKLRKLDKPHQTLVKRYEGHGFHAEKNRVELYAKIEKFLAENL